MRSSDAPATPRTARRCPGVVPPFLLDRLARAGDAALAEPAQRTLTVDRAVRAVRLTRRPTRPGEPGPSRRVFDAQGRTALPGVVVREEGAPSRGDDDVDEAYDGLGATWTLLMDVYGRDSLDGAGSGLDATVHYGQRYDNAFWDGERMVFGDGDGIVFRGFTDVPSVIGHELAHGLVQETADLVYRGQPGALNESVSDVVGALVEQRLRGQDAASASWLIGEGLFLPGVQGRALRDMAAPGTAYDDPRLGRDPQPGHMDDYVETDEDDGGVHINSGIPNRAFHLTATALGGSAWERAGQVWYDTLTGGSLARDADFAAFAAATAAAAGARYGAGSPEQEAVRAGWAGVGLEVR
ncbi:M4 family metallopeptidase [Vallicoccus soli]|uniref:Neutral metalloproteinase n=1 Tax=Vallicoccus soli TaxID=2339232 RepID=A0A3A3Z1I0_9ACTN|nr:M4 family metallopeptidase [Vallicoccus soli]RJK97033.1 M4 family peptidase [Vallicoccus soli]